MSQFIVFTASIMESNAGLGQEGSFLSRCVIVYHVALTRHLGNLHELCRLLARIRANYQVSELYETPGDAPHLSLQLSHDHWCLTVRARVQGLAARLCTVYHARLWPVVPSGQQVICAAVNRGPFLSS
jgi:hypothetical protein